MTVSACSARQPARPEERARFAHPPPHLEEVARFDDDVRFRARKVLRETRCLTRAPTTQRRAPPDVRFGGQVRDPIGPAQRQVPPERIVDHTIHATRARRELRHRLSEHTTRLNPATLGATSHCSGTLRCVRSRRRRSVQCPAERQKTFANRRRWVRRGGDAALRERRANRGDGESSVVGTSGSPGFGYRRVPSHIQGAQTARSLDPLALVEGGLAPEQGTWAGFARADRRRDAAQHDTEQRTRGKCGPSASRADDGEERAHGAPPKVRSKIEGTGRASAVGTGKARESPSDAGPSSGRQRPTAAKRQHRATDDNSEQGR